MGSSIILAKATCKRRRGKRGGEEGKEEKEEKEEKEGKRNLFHILNFVRLVNFLGQFFIFHRDNFSKKFFSREVFSMGHTIFRVI